jgi:hypothetical protein
MVFGNLRNSRSKRSPFRNQSVGLLLLRMKFPVMIRINAVAFGMAVNE